MDDNQKVYMKDQELIADLLDSEKYLSSVYQTATIEAATPAVRENFVDVLNSTLEIQNDVFVCMNENGWYPIDVAEKSKVDMAKTKYPKDPMNV